MIAMHRLLIEKTPLRELFDKDPDRAKHFSLEAAGIFLDYSKNRITEEKHEPFAQFRAKGGFKKSH